MISPVAFMKNVLRQSPLRRAVMLYRHTGLTRSDVFLASYPRSGNTWLKSLLTSCLFGRAMQNFSDRVDPVIPIVGFHRRVKPLVKGTGRIIKTHEPYRAEYGRAVWIVRDPRDVVISEYKLHLRAQTFFGSFEKFVVWFSLPRVQGSADWQTHTCSWLNCPLSQNRLLPVKFEDMRTNTGRELDRILRFMGFDMAPSVIETAIVQNSLQSMSERHAAYDRTLDGVISTGLPAVNTGLSGGWRSCLTQDQVSLIEGRFGITMDRLGYERGRS